MDNIQHYSINQVSAMLSIGRTKLYDLMNSGNLKFVNIRSVRRISHEELARFLAI